MHPMLVRPHRAKAVDVAPHPLVGGVEDVGTVDVRHHAGLGVARGVAVAGDMRTLVDDQHFIPSLSESAADDRAAESSAHDAISHSVDVRLLFLGRAKLL